MLKEERDLAVCLKCGWQWFTKKDRQNRQCHKCLSLAVLAVGEYKKDFQHLQKIVSPEEAEKFVEVYDYLVQQKYISAEKVKDLKLRYLLKDLVNSNVSLGLKN